MSYLERSTTESRLRGPALIVCAALVLGIFLPYLTGAFGVPLFNIPWSLAFGLIPYAVEQLSEAFYGLTPHWLEIASVISSPVLVSYLLLQLVLRISNGKSQRVWLSIFIASALVDVPQSVVFERLINLPLFHRFLAF